MIVGAHEGAVVDKIDYLKRYLHRHIPITKGMGVKVLEANGRKVVLEAPLLPNINHQGTVFGGSAASVAVLSAWSLIRIKLMEGGNDSNIVVHKASIVYRRPIKGAFTSTTVSCSAGDWKKVLSTLSRFGRAKVRLSSVLQSGGEKVGELEGNFVVMHPKE